MLIGLEAYLIEFIELAGGPSPVCITVSQRLTGTGLDGLGAVRGAGLKIELVPKISQYPNSRQGRKVGSQ